MEFNFPKIEEKILKFWKENKIFEKSLEQRKKARNFVFYEGPPTANAKPGIHHVLPRVFKDIICRYKTMRGFKVLRKAGWDTHGLPVELEIEKKLGLKNKKDIEKYGIAEFNKKCKESVWEYKKDWEKLTERVGFWLDMENPYITYEPEYIETVWWIIKQISQKGLLYKDYKVVPFCPRCGTSLSSHEVAQGYERIKEPAIYVKFKILDPKFENTYLLVWTTTAWTLPGNVAVAINPEIDYVKVHIYDNKTDKEEFLILAKSIYNNNLKNPIDKRNLLREKLEYDMVVNLPENTKVIKGKDLLGLEYEPLFDFIKPDKKAYFVIAGDFVSTDEGTGLVHIAPAFGEDDMIVGKTNNLPVLLNVDEEGKFKPEVKNWAGMFVKDADPLIIEDLRKRNLLFKEELYEHDYPFCWRCGSPLLYYAKESWFINMQKVKKDLIGNNQKINWVPSHLKEGRFGEWLREIKDWAISRERYWGTPLPIWQCGKCHYFEVIGSIEELNQKSSKKIEDLHRPYIDEIKFKCQKCGGEMRRIPEVIDCWFDSGSMPFAQYHYPFEDKNLIDKKQQFPADYISEAIDQTRGWFYTLLAISTLLGEGPCYKNVISLGHVLDEKGEKMSKSKGNVVDPWYIVEKYGADAARWYFYTVNQPGDPKLFSEKDVEGSLKKFIIIFWNCYLFFKTYAQKSKIQNLNSKHILDKWIISKLNGLIQQATESLEKYDVTSAARLIEKFVIEDFSQWYIRRSRKRFRPESPDFREASATLNYVILALSKLTAPFTPFVSEEICRNLQSSESVHLENWPKTEKKLINKDLEEKMQKARGIVALALAERAVMGIKVRQPLSNLKVKSKKLEDELTNLIKEEVNVKEVVFDEKLGKEIELDTKITPELREEGEKRDFIRNIKDLRKNLRLTNQDEIFGATGPAEPPFDFDDPDFKKEIGAQRIEKKTLEEMKSEGYSIKEGKEGRHIGIKKIEK